MLSVGLKLYECKFAHMIIIIAFVQLLMHKKGPCSFLTFIFKINDCPMKKVFSHFIYVNVYPRNTCDLPVRIYKKPVFTNDASVTSFCLKFLVFYCLLSVEIDLPAIFSCF